MSERTDAIENERQPAGRDANPADPREPGHFGDESPRGREPLSALTLARCVAVHLGAGDLARATRILGALIERLEAVGPTPREAAILEAEFDVTEAEFEAALDRPAGVVVSLADARARKAR